MPATRSCTRTGDPYDSRIHRNTLRRLEIRSGTDRTGSCLDVAAAESFFSTVKIEIGVQGWPDRAGARRDIENWITGYNVGRLRSALNYQTPTPDASRLAGPHGNGLITLVCVGERRDSGSICDIGAPTGSIAGLPQCPLVIFGRV